MTDPKSSIATSGTHAHRVMFVDLTRALAVVFMITGHTVSGLLDPAYASAPWFPAWQFQRGLTSSLFLLLSGFAFGVATSRRWASHVRLSRAVFHRLRRFAFFLALGYTVHMPVRSVRLLSTLDDAAWRSFVAVDVLQLIGATFIAVQVQVFVCRTQRIFTAVSVVLAAVILAITPAAWDHDWTTRLPAAALAYFTPIGGSAFPMLPFAVSRQRGDVQGRLHALEPDALDFSTLPGFTRATLEPKIKTINQMVLCSYPLPAPSDQSEDRCRRAASVNEYQGVAATPVKAAYGGPGMPSPTYRDNYVDTSWTDAGQIALYRNVLTPACRVCHMVRGTGSQSDIDFETFEKFDGYSDRIKAHMVDRGNMPLAKLVSDAFYADPAGVASITGFLSDKGYADAALRPGRPVADPGPGRVVKRGATTLSAAGSLFASAYQWSIVSGPNGVVPPTQASLSLPNSAQPVFNASADGSYVLQLVASSASSSSAPTTLTVVVRDDLRSNGVGYAPAALRFADVKAVLQSANAGCVGCHNSAGEVLPPIHFIAPDQSTDIDRNGDGRVDATDNLWFYTELRGRINFTDIVASPLLRKPSGNHHAGGQLSGFNTSFPPGHAARSDYDLVLNWILNGAPYN